MDTQGDGGMKTEFEAQHYYLKWLGALPAALIAVLVEFIISRYIESGGIGFFLVCLIVMAAAMCGYYTLADKLKLFRCKGCYADRGGFIEIELGKERYEIRDVNVLLYGEMAAFTSKCPYITIETPEGSVKIFGRPFSGSEDYKGSELSALSALILEKHPELKPRSIMNVRTQGWYEKSE